MEWEEIRIADIFFAEFMTDDGLLCGLCGNRGVIWAHEVIAPTGVGHAVSRKYCICPNGRKMKEIGFKID